MRVTHPFHPKLREEIDFVVHRHNWGEDRVYCREPDGHLASLPARWTSVVPEDLFVTVAAGRSRFRVEDLVDLAVLIGSRWGRLRPRRRISLGPPSAQARICREVHTATHPRRARPGWEKFIDAKKLFRFD